VARILVTLWLAGLLVGLAIVSGDLSWRQLTFYGVLFGLALLGRWSESIRRLEAPLWLILVAAVVLGVLGVPHPGAASAGAQGGVTGLLALGALVVSGGLLTGRWKRPVGGIVDVSMILFCMALPLAVLALQLFVHRYFAAVPTTVDVRALADRTLAVLAVYIVLSQFLLQNTRFRRSFQILWLVTLAFLVLLVAFRLGALGYDLLQLKNSRFENETLVRRVEERASRLDVRWVRQLVAARKAEAEYTRGAIVPALDALDRLLPYQHRGRFHFLDRKIEAGALGTFLLGSRIPASPNASFAAMAIDERRGCFYLMDDQTRLYAQGRQGFQFFGPVIAATNTAAIQDLLWLEASQELLLLFRNSQVLALKIAHRPQNEPAEFQLGKRRQLFRRHPSPARALKMIPNKNCAVIAYGDFKIKPLIGSIPEYVTRKDRVLRPGKDLLRDVCFLASGEGGYILDAHGGIHPIGVTPIRYKDLEQHHKQRYHYWPGQNVARSIDCSADGRQVTIFDVYGGLHGMEKTTDLERVHYFGSVRPEFSQPEVASVKAAYGSHYVLHRGGGIDRRAGGERLFAPFRPAAAKIPATLLPLTLMGALGWILLRSPRRVPPASERSRVPGSCGKG